MTTEIDTPPPNKISPKSEDPDLRFKFWQLLAMYCSLGIAALGIFFVWWTLSNNALSARATMQQGMVRLVTDMDKVFVDQPDLYPYFYQCQEIDHSSQHYNRASAAAVQMLDVMDIAATQGDTFKSQWDTPQAWDNWIKDQLLRSPITRDRLKAYSSWYGRRLNSRYQDVENELQRMNSQNLKPCG